MARPTHPLNITLDAEKASRLARLVERMHVQDETLALWLLSEALKEADPEARDVVTLLDGISGTYERARLGFDHGIAGETVGLEEL
jgi:hypothetical protein